MAERPQQAAEEGGVLGSEKEAASHSAPVKPYTSFVKVQRPEVNKAHQHCAGHLDETWKCQPSVHGRKGNGPDMSQRQEL